MPYSKDVKKTRPRINSLTTYLLTIVSSILATTGIPEFTRIPENRATTIFSGIRVGICIFIDQWDGINQRIELTKD